MITLLALAAADSAVKASRRKPLVEPTAEERDRYVAFLRDAARRPFPFVAPPL